MTKQEAIELGLSDAGQLLQELRKLLYRGVSAKDRQHLRTLAEEAAIRVENARVFLRTGG